MSSAGAGRGELRWTTAYSGLFWAAAETEHKGAAESEEKEGMPQDLQSLFDEPALAPLSVC